MIRDMLPRLDAGETLSVAETAAAVRSMMHGEASEEAMEAFLRALANRGETWEEILGAAEALRAEAVPFPRRRELVLDTCGTGGDRSDTYNISTAAAFVAAAAGVPVAKHGNRSVSSRSGSADVLEALGANIEMGPESAAKALDETGITFLNARRFHPAMRRVANVRARIGQRTLFNWVGPLANPAGATHQVVGVPLVTKMMEMARALAHLGLRRALVVHGAGEIDELSLEGGNHGVESGAGIEPRRHWFELPPGLEPAGNALLRGGDPAQNAAIIRAVLSGEPGPRRDVLLLNAAAALWIAGKSPSLERGVEDAAESIDSGRARALLDRFVDVSRTLGEN